MIAIQYKTVIKFSLLFVLVVIMICALSACSFDFAKKNNGEASDDTLADYSDTTDGILDEANQDTSGQILDTQGNQETEILKFVDVHGEEFETQVLPEVTKHNYDYSFLNNSGEFYTYSDTNTGINAKLGIDVSKYQGDIDWNKVKNSGIEFVIIRLGFRGYGAEGTLNLDAKYKEYIDGATKAGLEIGVYFFSQAITDEEAIEEAEYVLDNIKEYNITGPVVFDTEEVKNVDDARTKGISGEQFTSCCVVFCDRIKESGYKPMIYFNMVWQAFTLDITKLNSYEKWYADYEPQPQSPYDFSIWQYTESGSVDGISGNVDLNLWFK